MLKRLAAPAGRRLSRPSGVVLAIVVGAVLVPATLHVAPLDDRQPMVVTPASGAQKAAPRVQAAVPTAAATSTALEWLKIPAIGVDAHIEQVGLTPQGNMEVPKDVRNVGWYDLGPWPGQQGDAVIAGHLNWHSGPAVFWRLSSLRAGDTVEVLYRDGKKLSFRIQRLTSYAYDQPPVDLFSPHGPARLSLITCAGSWSGQMYRQRLVVDAVLSSEEADNAAS